MPEELHSCTCGNALNSLLFHLDCHGFGVPGELDCESGLSIFGKIRRDSFRADVGLTYRLHSNSQLMLAGGDRDRDCFLRSALPCHQMSFVPFVERMRIGELVVNPQHQSGVWKRVVYANL